MLSQGTFYKLVYVKHTVALRRLQNISSNKLVGCVTEIWKIHLCKSEAKYKTFTGLIFLKDSHNLASSMKGSVLQCTKQGI